MAIKARPCLVNSAKISHLGINPESGGRPPRDNRIRGVMALRAGDLAHEIARALMFVELFILNTINVEKDMMKYRMRVIREIDGENGRTRDIHPR